MFAIIKSDRKLKNKYFKYKKLIEEHKRLLFELKKQVISKYGANHLFPKFHWQKSYRDHYIRNPKDFDEHLKYIYNNPIKHRIPNAENYKYIFTNYPDLISEF